MAWVCPSSGLVGNGPTVLIAMSAIFPLAINTIAGVQGIDSNYYNAARMGASKRDIVRDMWYQVPSHILLAALAMGAGWMSVICAEFIATSAGFGFLMVDRRLETAQLAP